MKQKQGSKVLMDKRFTFTTSQDFIDTLSEARWYLKKSQAQLIRDAVYEYLDKHLPKDVKDKILKKEDR